MLALEGSGNEWPEDIEVRFLDEYDETSTMVLLVAGLVALCVAFDVAVSGSFPSVVESVAFWMLVV